MKIERGTRYWGNVEKRRQFLTQSTSGTIPEGGLPVQWVKSMDLVPVGRQKIRNSAFLSEVFNNEIRTKKAIEEYNTF